MDRSCYSLSLFLGVLSFLFLLLEKSEIGWTLLISGGVLFFAWVSLGAMSLYSGGDPLKGLGEYSPSEEEECIPSS